MEEWTPPEGAVLVSDYETASNDQWTPPQGAEWTPPDDAVLVNEDDNKKDKKYTFLLPDGSVQSIEKQFIPQFLKDNPDAEFQKDGTMQTKAAGFDPTEAYGDAYSRTLNSAIADATPTQKDLDNLKKAEDEVVDLKSNDIRYEDFNGKSEEELVSLLDKMPQYADRFLFSEDTAGMDRLQVYDKILKKYFYVDLNTAYNNDEEQYAREEDGNYKIVNGELVPGGIKGTDVTNKGTKAYKQFLDIIKPNQGFIGVQQPEYGFASLGSDAETGKLVKAKEDYYYGIDRESKVPIIEDGKVVYKNVPFSETAKSGTFNPTIVEIEDDEGVKREVEVPDEVVIRAKELLFDDVAKYQTLEKAVKQVLEDDELLAGQMRLKSLMGGEREKEEEEVNNFIKKTIKDTNISLGDKYDNLTTENIDTFYTLGFPKWEREEEYLKAKQEFENLTWDALPGGQPSAEYTRIAQQYEDIKNERETALIPKVDEWLNNDLAGQKVFNISQDIKNTETEAAMSTEAYAETKLNFPNLNDNQLVALTNAKISENIFTESYSAFEDNTYGFFLPEGEFKTSILTTAKEFNTRQTELVKNREEAFIKYYEESGDQILAKQKSLEEFPITKEDGILQNKLASLVHTWLNDDKIDIYQDIEGKYGNTIYSRGTSEERNEPGYVQSQVEQYQFADTDWLNKRIFKNDAEIISLATQLANKGDWYSTGSFAQQMYNVAGEIMGSDQALNKDIARIQAIANSGKLPLHLTTIPNSDDPLVKRWNDAIEDRALMGVGKLLNVDWTTATREGFWGQAGNMGSGFDYQELDNNESISRMFKEIKASGIELTDAEEMQTNEQIGALERAGSAVPDLTRMGVEMAATFWLTGGASTLTSISRFIAGNTFRAAEFAGMGARTSANLTKFFTGVGTEFAALEGASIMDPLFDKEGMSMAHNFRLALTLGLGRAGIAKAGEKFNQALTGYSAKLAEQGNYTLDNVIQLGNTAGLETVSSALKFSVLTPGTSAVLMQVEGAVENIVAGEGIDKIFYDITNGEQLFETYASFVVMGLAHPSQGWKKAREVYENEVSRIAGDNTMWNAAYLEAGLTPVRGEKVHSNYDVDKAIEKKISEVKSSNVPKSQKINQIQHLNNLGNKLKLKEHFQQLDADIRNQELTAKNQAAQEIYKNPNLKYEDLNNSQKKIVDNKYKEFNIYHNTRRLNATATSLKAGNKPTPADMINLDRASQTNITTAIKALIESGYSNVNATNLVMNAKAIGTYCRLNYGTDLYSPSGKAYVFNAMEISKLQGEIKGLEEQRKLSVTDYEKKIANGEITWKKKQIDDLYIKNEGIAEAKRVVDLETIGKEDIKRLEEAGVPIIEETTTELKKRFEEEFPGETFNENQSGWQFERDPREFIIDKTTGKKVENKNFGKPLAIINKNVAKASTIKHEAWGHGSTDLLFAESALKERTDNILKGNNKLSPEEARQQAETEVLDYVEKVKEYVRKRGGGEIEAVNERMTVTGVGGNGKWAEYVESVEAGGPRNLTFEKEWLSEFLELSTEKAFDLGKSEKDFGEVTTFSPTKMTPNEYAKFILEGGALANKGVVEALKADREARVKQEEKYGDETSKVSASEKISKASKEAADKNKSIETKIVDQGSGKVRIREIKNAKFQKQIKKELTDNNQTMIEVRARKAANNPRIQSLEPSKRISADMFKSAFNKEFAEALGQYKPIVDGKRIPFGAYMNQRLTQRFKQALEEIKKGQFEGPEIRLQQPTREGKRGFDAESRDLNPEEAMIAKEGTYESKEIFKDRIDPRSEIIDPQKRTAWDKKIDTKFDKEFTTTDKEGKVKLDLEKLEELDYSTLEDFAEESTAEFFGIDVATLRGKNPRYSRTDKKGKIKVDEGIPKEAENYNLNKKLWDISEKYVKLLNETQLFPKDIIEADIKKAQETYKKNPTEKNNKALQKLKDIKRLQGEQKTGDQAKQGTSLGIDASILKALYETSDIRAMTGPGPKIKSTKLNVDEFRERAGIQPPGKFKSRSLEKLTKEQENKLRNEDTLKAALARKWGDAVTNVRVREKLEAAKTKETERLKEELPPKERKQIEETKKAVDKSIRELKAGSSRFSASVKLVEGLLEAVKAIEKGDKLDLNSIAKRMGLKGKELDVFTSISPRQFKRAVENDVVNQFILKELIKNNLATAKGKRVVEDITIRDIARREEIDIQGVKDRYIKNAFQKNAKELVEGLGYEYKSAADRGSEANYKKARPYLVDFIQRLIPKGKSFADLPKDYQQMILNTLGFGDGTYKNAKKKDGSPQIGGQQLRDRPFTYKEWKVEKGNKEALLKKVFDMKDSELKGKGEDVSSFSDKFYYPGDFGGKGRNILNIAKKALGLPELKKLFQKNYKGRGREETYKEVLDANKEALQRLYDVMKEVVIKSENPIEALEHIIDLQLAQTNRATGGIKGLAGMESVTMVGKKSKPKSKDVHNEHLTELFSMTKDFSLALDRHLKGEQTLEGLELQLKRMVEDANQALITEKRRSIKDASGAAVRDYLNNLIFLGKDAAKQIPLKEGAFGEVENMAEFIRDNATKALIEQIKNTPYDKLTEAAILAKQRETNKPNYNEIGKETTSLVKEANMSTKPKFSASEKMSPREGRERLRIRDKALELARNINKPIKKARVFDFDDTVARTKSNVLYEMPNGKKGKISAEEFAKRGGEMEAKGAKWDFSEFNKVVDGKKGPLFEVMKKMKEAAGERDMFILTARSPDAAKAIQRFMKEMGIDIPLENIKGLGDSSPFAKSDWILEKASEGYNDFYFADDHAPNVKAVKDALSRLDVKGKTQQAKVKFSASIKKNLEKNENYKKFRDLIAKEKLFHGGSITLGDFNAVWFVTGDVKGAWSYAVENDSRVYSVEAKDLKDTIIIPDMNDAKGFYDFAKEKFPNQIDAIQNRVHGSNRLIDSVDIKRVLEQPNASEILNEFIDWSQDNFNMGAFPLGNNRAINSIYDGKSITKGLPVIVVKRPSNWESNPKLVTEVLMKDVYREEKIQKEKDIKQEKWDARKEKINKAVQKVLNIVDIKRPIQKDRMSASIKLDKDFNKILEEKSGIEWYKDFSKSKGKVVGARKGKYKIFLPPGAEDFTGLIYPTLGKGKKGEAQLEWYNDNLIKPYNRATRNLATDKVQLMNDFKGLKKQLEMPKDLRKVTKSGYTKEQAARVYLWDKMGEKVPNLTKTDLAELLDIVNSDGKLKAFADQILEATKGDGYSTPGKEWLSGTMTTDLIDVLNVNKRKKYLEEWQENIDIIYSEKNLNKLEAIYGSKYRVALENSIKRMKTGKNRTSTGNKASDALLDYINGAQGTIMFLNMRSAVLQSISAANFVNLSFNNPIKAGKAFINQKQYWKDFMSIMNSDYLVGRRQGLKLNISESEIADAAAGSTNKAKAAINYILEKGYAPTKFMDSFAIASGGATWYRNKIKDLMKKEGLSEVEAQKKAFEEFMEISEKSQQSSDPSKISAQQASDMGRIFLQFANTPMQYVRMQKRAAQDLANKRGDWKSNIGKILYYGVIQNIWFNAMQQGLFALGFGDDEINENEEKKIVNTANGMADSILRGSGFAGMTVSVLKNTIIDLYRRSGRQQPKYGDAWMKLLEFSPAIKSKFGKLKSAAWPFDTKKGREEIKEKGFSLDNPAYESGAKVISAATNIPLDRLFLKYNNLKAMMSEETETWKDIALFLGWPEYQLEEGGTVQEDKIRNMKNDTKKDEQKQMLLDLGYTIREVSWFRKEEDRVKAIISGQNGVKLKPPPSRKPKED